MDYQKKAFEVEISNGGPRGYETAITLKLPATWAEFHDALQKARIPDGRNCGIELTRSWWAGLSSELIGGAQNLYELNLFAMRLTMLTSVELLSMDGLLKMEQARGTKSIPIPRLINLTFNADCHILPDVFNDESLGAFLYENEMLTKEAMCLLDTTEPGSGYHGRLLEVFGEEHRQTIGGVFTSCGYRCLCENTGLSTEQKEKLATLEQPLQAIRDRWRQTHPTPEPELLEACEALTTSQQQSEETPALSMTL